MVAKPRVFLSVETDELEPTRQALLEQLLSCGCDVVVETYVDQTAVDTIKKLDRIIRTCDAVVHVAGHQRGVNANDQAVQSFLQSLDAPDSFLADQSGLRDSLGDCSGITLSQWEALLALDQGVTRLAYAPVDRDVQDSATGPIAEQADYYRLMNGGIDAKHFEDDTDLVAKVIADLKTFFPTNQSRQDLPLIFRKRPSNLPYSTLGSRFKGRDRFLRDLHDKFLGGKDGAATTRSKTVAIQGDGGVGKTRAAVEYALRHIADYSAVLFLSAASSEALDNSLAKLVHVLPIEGMQEATDDVRQTAVFDWLQSNPVWLMILDNVDTEEAAEAVQDRLEQVTCGHLLITSRLSQWMGPVNEVRLDPLELETATQYLLETTDQRDPAQDDNQQAKQVAEKVRRLPLGLELAAAYINRLEIRFVQYVMQWEIHENVILSEFDLTQIDYPHELLVAWKLSVDQLDEQARQLLEMLAWFASTPISESMLARLPDVCLAGDTKHALMTLKRWSLLSHQTIADEAEFWLHELVQAITRNHLRHQPAKGAIPLASLDDALRWIDAVFQGDVQDVRVWQQLESYLEHVLSICEFAFRASKTTIDHATARLTSDVAALYFVKARFQEADPLMRRVLEIDERAYGPEHPHVAIRLNNLAVLLNATGRLLEAEPLMRRTLAIVEQAYGARHPKVAIRLNNLAQLLKETDRLPEAEPLMRRALSIDEQQYGPVHPKVAIRLNNLTQLLQATNRLLDAEPLMRRAVLIDEQEFGPEHTKVAVRLHNLARLLQDANYFSEAEPAMRLRTGDLRQNLNAPPSENRHSVEQLSRATSRYGTASRSDRRADCRRIEYRRGVASDHAGNRKYAWPRKTNRRGAGLARPAISG